MLHRFSKFLVGCTVVLILAGSLVTSTGSGLSVPDWPTSYGWNMFTFPPSMWVANILYEHGHRLIASSVGFLTIILTIWLWMAEPRRWLRWLGVAALAAVIAQGVLGGLTVLFYLPPAVSTAHAGLAEIFFCMTVAIALFAQEVRRGVRAFRFLVTFAAKLEDGASLRAHRTRGRGRGEQRDAEGPDPRSRSFRELHDLELRDRRLADHPRDLRLEAG